MPRPTNYLLDYLGELKPYQPTLREQIAGWLGKGGLGLGEQKRNDLMGLADWSPVGAATGLYDAGQALGAGQLASGGLMAAMSVAPPPVRKMAKKGIRAFHGSPHNYAAERRIAWPDGREEFIEGRPDILPDVPQGATVLQDYPLGRMRMDKIGTGEGAQAYGHGLYNAEAETVAKEYRDRLTQMRASSAQRMLQQSGDDVDTAIAKVRSEIDRLNNLPNAGNDAAKRDRFVSLQEEKLAELTAFKNSGSMSKGSMYEVSIDASPDDFLDWDKPLSEQGPELQEKLSGFSPHMTGAQINESARLVPGEYRNNKVAQENLQAKGIPGIKYLDAGSRTAGDGSRNYVVFDDSIISIVRKYGIAGALAAGAISQVDAQQLQEQGYQ